MATRKRAPGGGRKPKGELRQLDAPFSLRMPADLRKQLENAAKRNGRSISQEMLRRVRSSFLKERDRGIDPSIRALSFLIWCIHQQIFLKSVWADNSWGDPVTEGRHWRTNASFYKAFSAAVQTLLGKFQPVGNDSLMTASPEDVGVEVANHIWWELNNPQLYDLLLKKMLNELEMTLEDDPPMRELFTRYRQSNKEIYYGLADAKRDLQLNSEGEQQ